MHRLSPKRVACCRRVKQRLPQLSSRDASAVLGSLVSILCGLAMPGHKSWCRRSPSRKARRGRMVKRSVLLPVSHLLHTPASSLWPLTAPEGTQRPYRPPPAHISVRSAYSTCPPRPQPACQPALGLVDDNTLALASIVPPLRGRRKDAGVLLSSSVSPYNVAVRHYAG